MNNNVRTTPLNQTPVTNRKNNKNYTGTRWEKSSRMQSTVWQEYDKTCISLFFIKNKKRDFVLFDSIFSIILKYCFVALCVVAGLLKMKIIAKCFCNQGTLVARIIEMIDHNMF